MAVATKDEVTTELKGEPLGSSWDQRPSEKQDPGAEEGGPSHCYFITVFVYICLYLLTASSERRNTHRQRRRPS